MLSLVVPLRFSPASFERIPNFDLVGFRDMGVVGRSTSFQFHLPDDPSSSRLLLGRPAFRTEVGMHTVAKIMGIWRIAFVESGSMIPSRSLPPCSR